MTTLDRLSGSVVPDVAPVLAADPAAAPERARPGRQDLVAVVGPTPSDVWCSLAPDVRSDLLRTGGLALTPAQVVALGDAGEVVVLGDQGTWEIGPHLGAFVARLSSLLPPRG